jgi:hypothetical protein
VSRAYYDRATGKLYAAFNYPGVVAHVGAIDLATGDVERLVDVKGPVIYTVTSLAYDPTSAQLYYTTDNGAHRDLVRLDPRTRRTEVLMKDARIGDLAFNRADRSLWGIRHLNGIVSLVRMEPPYREWTRVHSWPYGTVVYDLDVSPDGTRLAASFGEIDGAQDVRVFATTGSWPATSRRSPASTSARRSPPASSSPRTAGRWSAAPTTRASRTSSATTSRRASVGPQQRRDRVLPPVPRPEDDDLFVFRYSGEGFVPTRIEAKKLEHVSAITFFGERLIDRHPVLHGWLGSPIRVDVESKQLVEGRYASQAAAARIRLPDPPGLQGHGGRGPARQLLGSRCS